MVFFNTGTDDGGNASLTIPLTVLVLAVWQLWWRKREADAGLADSSRSKNHGALLGQPLQGIRV